MAKQTKHEGKHRITGEAQKINLSLEEQQQQARQAHESKRKVGGATHEGGDRGGGGMGSSWGSCRLLH